jgi:hypothetical protein
VVGPRSERGAEAMASFDPDLYKRALDIAAREHGDKQVP